MKIVNDNEFQRLLLTRELVSRGLRTFVVSSLTGVEPCQVKQLYKLKGKTPKVGLSPKTRTICKSRMSQVRLSIFASIYLRMIEGKVAARIDPQHLMLSHDIAQSLFPTPELDMTVAWSIATELKIGEVDFPSCPHCGLGYLRIYESNRLPLSCPFCALRDRIGRCRPRHDPIGAI